MANTHAATQWVPLAGSARKLLPQSMPVGPVDPDATVALTIGVRPRTDPAALEKFVAELADKPVRQRKYKSREELARDMAADPQDLEQVELYATRHHLRVVERD